jgi:exoribonuclease-2
MYLFFEEDGTFKVGTILSQNGSAYQVELLTGRRTKVKGGHVFFEFESPAASEVMGAAEQMAAEMDPQFLWEVAPEGEFQFTTLAKEYFGEESSVVESVATLLALHGNPVYFHRKGRGNYRKAPAEILKAALAALEKKRLAEEQKKRWVRQMVDEKTAPKEIASQAINLLVSPDKNSNIWKALSDAASESRMTPLRLLLSLGAIASPYRWHVDSFYAQYFPKGKGFPSDLSLPSENGWDDLPIANVKAFSIDDSSTTEIDDATSVEHVDDQLLRIGVHIAAPGLGIVRDSDIDRVARSRLSTVYAPGIKTTMLPEAWIKEFSLDEGRAVPCLSLYALVNKETLEVSATETHLERIKVASNIRYDLIENEFTEEKLLSGTVHHPFAEEITWLWKFAKKCLADREAVRGKPENLGRVEWSFDLEGEGEDAVIHLKSRRRGSPLDLAVGELMIFANTVWGGWLEEVNVAGIYRSQSMGRVKMSTTPGPHDGMGVAQYAWSTSPLRRYVDLVNQRQLISAVLDRAPSYRPSDTDLFTIVSNFTLTYGAYSEFQRKMERYWSLRWIEQENLKTIEAVVVKGELIRIEGLPFMQRMPGLPELPRGQKILLDILGVDYVDVLLEARLKEVLDETDEEALDDEEPIEETERSENAADSASSEPS